MQILAICTFPKEAAATRFRLEQFVEPLRGHGIELDVRPFLDGKRFRELYSAGGSVKKVLGLLGPVLERIALGFNAGRYDLLLIQREAMPFGPAIFEWLYKSIGRVPMVLDLDDATYVRYVSPSYGRLGTAFKFFGKTDKLIGRADLVICGNRFIAEYVEKRGTRSVVIPTIVDTEKFKPVEKQNSIPVLGWIGTHSTFPFLENLFPVLSDLAKKHRFKLKIVGSGRTDVTLDGVEIENLDWRLEREIEDFQSLDIGLYPMAVSESASDEWLAGKSGFKAIQYMAVGVPFVMSPVGVCAEIGIAGETHLNAESPEDWYNSLDRLLSSDGLRKKTGDRARSYSEEHYGLEKHTKVFRDYLSDVARRRIR